MSAVKVYIKQRFNKLSSHLSEIYK
ncbi:6-carboxytetrahydropterin synthase QueD, partial [Vibrio parahaemolyticus]